MCKHRKYQSYKIIVNFDNGEREEVKFNGIKQTSYIEMLKAYRETKDLYKDKSCKIEFIGVSSEGELEVRWFKEFKSEKKGFQEAAEEYTNKCTHELLHNIDKNIDLLSRREIYLRDMLEVINRQEYVISHQIERWDLNKGATDKDKLEKFDELMNVRNERRYMKMELEKLDIIKETVKFSNSIKNVLDRFNSIDEGIQNGVKFLDDTELENKKIFKVKKYDNEVQRDSIIERLSKKYKRVVYDDSKAEIYAFNYAKHKKVV